MMTAYEGYMDDPHVSLVDGYVVKDFVHLCIRIDVVFDKQPN